MRTVSFSGVCAQTSIFKQFPGEKYLLTIKSGIVPLLDLLELEDLSVVEAVFCLINEVLEKIPISLSLSLSLFFPLRSSWISRGRLV